jgi:ABC-2 type transport system ATP-binding protein
MSGAAAIEVSHLSKIFGGRTAVDDVSFSVSQGEVFGFLGPNGAGKTTMVRMLGTLIAPTSGSASVAGIPLNPAGGPEIRRRISITTEAPGLYKRLTVAENLDFFARLYGLPGRQARIFEALSAVGLADRADDLCGSLSKGLRQRASLARSLLNEPEVMFLDEPTAGLDPQGRLALWELLGGLNAEGQTILLTTHYMEEADKLCDRLAIMDHGKVLALDTPAELKRSVGADTIVTVKATGDTQQLADAFTERLEGLTRTRQIPDGVELQIHGSERLVPRVVEAAEAAGFSLADLSVTEPTLETVFIGLTGEELRD